MPERGDLMRGLIRTCAAALGLVAVIPLPLPAQEPVPVHREPRHRLVWEDGPVRILDVRVPPGDTSLYHIHDTAILYVPIAVAPIDAQPLGGRWIGTGPRDTSRFRTGTVATDTQYAARPLTHRVANVGAGLFHLVAIVNGGAGDPAPPATTPPGRMETASSWFRQTRVELAAGTATRWYESPEPVVLVQVGPGAATVELAPEGAALEGPGAWAYVPAGARFRVRSRGEASAIVLVEVR
jgi:hypothetical protein